MKTARTTRPYTGPLPSAEDLEQACVEVMESAFPEALCYLADESESMRALLIAIRQTYMQMSSTQDPKAIQGHTGYTLIRGIMIGMLAERRRRNGKVQ